MAIAPGGEGVNGRELSEIFLNLVGEGLCLPGAADDVTKTADHREGACQVMDIADPYGIAGGEGFDLFTNVLFLIGDDEVWLEGGYFFGADVFGAAYPGLGAKPVIGMDAEFGDADDFGVQPQGV